MADAKTPDYSGMTLNERLFAAGVFEQWDDAVRRRDRGRMIAILTSVDLGAAAETSADAVLNNPGRYGY